MAIETIVTLGLLGLSTLISVFSLIKTGKRKSNTTSTNQDTTEQTENTENNSECSKNFFERFQETLSSLIGNIDCAENLFNAISTGKTGNLKLSNVLDKIKVDCLTKGEEYNESYWKTIIDKLIDFTKSVNK